MAIAITEQEAFEAWEMWVKLKAVLVQPRRGGWRRKNSNLSHWQTLMDLWTAGGWKDCWKIAADIEAKRRARGVSNRGNRNSSKKKTMQPENNKTTKGLDPTIVITRTQKKAKNQVNLGDLSRAVTTLTSKGVAEVTDAVLDKLKAKHPKRKWTTKVVRGTGSAKNGAEGDDFELEQEHIEKEPEETSIRQLETMRAKAKEKLGKIMPIIRITTLDVEKTVMASKRTVSGGLEHITPWMLKSALTSQNNPRCSFSRRSLQLGGQTEILAWRLAS